MLPGKQYTPADYAAMAWQHKWIIVVPLILGAYAGLVVSSRIPNLYRAEMLIQVVPQRVPDTYVRSTVTMQTADRLSALNEQITSRTELERLITEMNLYPEERAVLPMQDVVERMRGRIDVDSSRTGNRDADSFYVRFTYSDPDVAASVTQRLGDLFIDVNARDRGLLAQQTNNFLETELEEAKRNLEAQEDRLKRFREQNAGRLPTQLQYNMQALQNAQTRAQQLVEALARDRDQRLLVEQLYKDAEATIVVPSPAPQAAQASSPQQAALETQTGTTAQRLASARQLLASLELRYTPEYPDVRRTKSLIETLEEELAEETRLAQEAANEEGSGRVVTPVGVNPQELARQERLQQLRAQMESLDRQIGFREQEADRIQAEIEDLQRRIEQVPGVESEWISISRDYDQQQAAYNELLAKSSAAKLAANLEQRQIGEQFRILDPPRPPLRPTGVNRLEVNAMGAGLGLLIGLSLAGLLELRDCTFHQSADIAAVLNMPVIALVPQVETEHDRQRARTRLLLVSATVAVATVVAGYGFWTLQLWKYLV